MEGRAVASRWTLRSVLGEVCGGMPLAVLCLIAGMGCVGAARRECERAGSVERAGCGLEDAVLIETLGWLPPEQTDLVIVSKGPFGCGEHVRSEDDPYRVVRLWPAVAYLSYWLESGLDDASLPFLAVEGAHNFRMPDRLGSMGLFDGCTILRFPASANAVLARWLHELRGISGVEEGGGESFKGIQIVEVPGTGTKDRWSTYVARPRSDTVVVATSLDYLRACLARMVVPSSDGELEDRLSVAKEVVDFGAPVWAVRLFSGQGPQARQGMSSGVCTSAQWVAFSYDPSEPVVGRLALKAENPAQSMEAVLGMEYGHMLANGTLAVSCESDGVVSFRVRPVGSDSRIGMSILAFLGHQFFL